MIFGVCGELWWIFGFIGIVLGLYWHLRGFSASILVRMTWIDCGEFVAECGHKMVVRSRRVWLRLDPGIPQRREGWGTRALVAV